MKRFNYRAGSIAFATTLALNSAHLLAFFYQVNNPASDALALAVGWGIDFPGMVAAITLGCLTSAPIFWLEDASYAELLILVAIAIFSGTTWFLAAGLIFRKKPIKTPQTTTGSLAASRV